jgi:hypothetical protein
MPMIFADRDPYFQFRDINNQGDIKKSVALRRLSVKNYINGFTEWFYRADGDASLDDLYASNYWHDARDMIRPGDLMMFRTKMACGNFTLTQVFFPGGASKPFTIMARG